MTGRNRAAIMLFCIIVFVVMGCASRSLPFEGVDVQALVTVHIVASKDEFPPDVRRESLKSRGCAYADGTIYIIGTRTADGIIVDQWLLGHELLHILSWRSYHRIKNPDL